MNRKILSSRVLEDDPHGRLQEFLFMVTDVLNMPFPDTTTFQETLETLDTHLVELAVSHADLQEANKHLSSDLLSYSIMNATLRQDLARLTDVISALIMPSDQQCLDAAVGALVSAGKIDIDAMTLEPRVIFHPDHLKDGVQLAIDRYNNELANKKL